MINMNLNNKFINELKRELSKFKSDEELLRKGGISTELLDRLAFGFSETDIKTLTPNQLNIKWKEDLKNIKWEINKSKLTPKQWASKVNLSSPIEVSYCEYNKHRGFYIEDGHHRFVAAKILNKPLNINLEIKINPIKTIAPNMSYDEFHRNIFKMYKNNELKENKVDKNNDNIIYELISEWIISSLSDTNKRQLIGEKLLKLNIPKEYKAIPNNRLYRIGKPKNKFVSYTYDYRGIKKMIQWYKRIYNKPITTEDLIETNINDVNVLICIPTFLNKTKLSSGRRFDSIWKSEYEVICVS